MPSSRESVRFLGRFFNGHHAVASDKIDRPNYPALQIGYAYGPSIVKVNGEYHLFCCAADFGMHCKGGGDLTRHSRSSDGVNWEEPRIVMYPFYKSWKPDPVVCSDCCCCDPSVVFFKGFWYLFYSGCPSEFQTAMYVARAEQLAEPLVDKFAKFTVNGTWERNAAEPATIIRPVSPDPSQYGAGQQSVVVKDGRLLSWFNDTTITPTQPNTDTARFATSDDGITWSEPITVKKESDGSDVHVASIDVKYDPVSGQFVMFDIGDHLDEGSFLRRRFSMDGIHWSELETLCDDFAFPNFAANVGVSGDENGHLLPEPTIVAYGVPHTDDIESIFTLANGDPSDADMCAHLIGGTATFDRGYFQFPAGGHGGTFFSDGQDWVGFLTAQELADHRAQNPRNDRDLGIRSSSEVGTWTGLWHSGMPIPA